MGRRKGPGTPAVAALETAGVQYEIRSYEHGGGTDVGYGLEAAQALGVPPARVFKTLMASVDGRVVVAVVPVTGQLDLKALAHAVGGKKAVMADQATAERATGYVVGGISPLGQRTSHPTVVDDSAEQLGTVLVSGGRRGLDLELAPQDLVRLTRATVAPVSRSR